MGFIVSTIHHDIKIFNRAIAKFSINGFTSVKINYFVQIKSCFPPIGIMKVHAFPFDDGD